MSWLDWGRDYGPLRSRSQRTQRGRKELEPRIMRGFDDRLDVDAGTENEVLSVIGLSIIGGRRGWIGLVFCALGFGR